MPGSVPHTVDRVSVEESCGLTIHPNRNTHRLCSGLDLDSSPISAARHQPDFIRLLSEPLDLSCQMAICVTCHKGCCETE